MSLFESFFGGRPSSAGYGYNGNRGSSHRSSHRCSSPFGGGALYEDPFGSPFAYYQQQPQEYRRVRPARRQQQQQPANGWFVTPASRNANGPEDNVEPMMMCEAKPKQKHTSRRIPVMTGDEQKLPSEQGVKKLVKKKRSQGSASSLQKRLRVLSAIKIQRAVRLYLEKIRLEKSAAQDSAAKKITEFVKRVSAYKKATCVKEAMKQLSVIKGDIAELHRKYVPSVFNLPLLDAKGRVQYDLLAYEESLIKSLLKLDNISTLGNGTVRVVRKSIVNETNTYLAEVDEFKKNNKGARDEMDSSESSGDDDDDSFYQETNSEEEEEEAVTTPTPMEM
eukprot:Nk52_evm50s2309 gene=Nk52_evmTU50s2309